MVAEGQSEDYRLLPARRFRHGGAHLHRWRAGKTSPFIDIDNVPFGVAEDR
jgi:hypothetical protein